MDRPICCDRVMIKNGTRKGLQRWRCLECGCSQCDNATAVGRPRIYSSKAEKQKVYRLRKELGIDL